MNGDEIFLDTNAFIYFFEGRSRIVHLVATTPEIYYSPLSEIELLSATHLTHGDIDSIKAFLLCCRRIELTEEIVNQTVSIRRQYRIKIPDAIIAASAAYLKVPLVTADAAFQKITGLELISDITSWAR